MLQDNIGNSGRILIVEDYPANIVVATSLLGILGYDYKVAQTGQEALDELEKEPFDIVLMDVQMPQMDGYKATELIRERERKRNKGNIPIIGMTAHAFKSDLEKCLAAGMDDYISKPFQPNELKEKIEKYLARSPIPEKTF